MFFTLRDIQNFQLRAADGDFGKIRTFLIDDFNWVVRYLVVEVGSRNVLLSVVSIGTPDIYNKVLPVNITKEKIMNSPVFENKQALTREMERRFSDYFGWSHYWEPGNVPNTLPGDLTAVPLVDMELEREQKEIIPETGSRTSQPENYLRSTEDMIGSWIHTTNDDHSAGKLSDLIAQDEDWNVLYLVVDSGGLLSGKKVLLSPSWVQKVETSGSRIDVNLKEDTIHDSPAFHSIDDLTEDYQDRLNDYYQS